MMPRLRLFRALVALALTLIPAAAGTITGAVSNAATRNLLEGARVAAPGRRL